jgi:hypothetical protein
MNSLKDISSEIIRKNWIELKEYVLPFMYNLIYDSFINKFKINKYDIFFIMLKRFIDNGEINYKDTLYGRIDVVQVDGTLGLEGLNERERNNICLLCDTIGLHHKQTSYNKQLAYPKKNINKCLDIYKPDIWLWEYTEKNPYTKTEEYYDNQELEKQRKICKFLLESRCYICHIKIWETKLFYFIGRYYCKDCRKKIVKYLCYNMYTYINNVLFIYIIVNNKKLK